MIRIEIETVKTSTRSGTSQRTGNAYSITEQPALLFREGERYPDKISITLADGQGAYPVGQYTLDDSSFSVSRFGGLEVRPVLKPVPAQQRSAA